jgi:hypothetical protein
MRVHLSKNVGGCRKGLSNLIKVGATILTPPHLATSTHDRSSQKLLVHIEYCLRIYEITLDMFGLFRTSIRIKFEQNTGILID